MRAKTLSAAVALTGLIALAGTAFATDPFDGYNRNFFGKISTQSDQTMGKAAYGTPTDPKEWRDLWSGHTAYNQNFFGKSGAPLQRDSMGTDSMGKAAYGTGTSDMRGIPGIDGLAAYQNVFPSD